MKRPLAAAMVFAFALGGPVQEARAVAPGVAGVLAIVPGLGHVSAGETWEGLGWFSATIGGYVFGKIHPFAPELGFGIWQYQAYDAYRDQKPKYRSEETWYENYIASFNPLNIVDPIGGPALVAYTAPTWIHGTSKLRGMGIRKVLAFGVVGWSEEALFRGFVYPGISAGLGSKFVGAFLSSVMFAAVHLEFAPAPMIVRSAIGLVFCWQTTNNEFDLRKSIFAHTWIDVLVANSAAVQGPGGNELGSSLPWNRKFDGLVLKTRIPF